jgi:hypothetical protein
VNFIFSSLQKKGYVEKTEGETLSRRRNSGTLGSQLGSEQAAEKERLNGLHQGAVPLASF